MTGPEVRRASLRVVIGIAAAVGAQVALQSTYRTVEAPFGLATYGLEADPVTLRDWYADLAQADRLRLLARTEVVDLLWPIALSAALVSIVLLVAAVGRDRRPRLAEGLRRWAPLFAIGPAFDLVENAFSIAMITDPAGFPDWWALAHGAAARVKFTGAVVGGVVGLTLTAIVLLSPRRHSGDPTSDGGSDVEPALSPR